MVIGMGICAREAKIMLRRFRAVAVDTRRWWSRMWMGVRARGGGGAWEGCWDDAAPCPHVKDDVPFVKSDVARLNTARARLWFADGLSFVVSRLALERLLLGRSRCSRLRRDPALETKSRLRTDFSALLARSVARRERERRYAELSSSRRLTPVYGRYPVLGRSGIQVRPGEYVPPFNSLWSRFEVYGELVQSFSKAKASSSRLSRSSSNSLLLLRVILSFSRYSGVSRRHGVDLRRNLRFSSSLSSFMLVSSPSESPSFVHVISESQSVSTEAS
jgi:hypothetical protein